MMLLVLLLLMMMMVAVENVFFDNVGDESVFLIFTQRTPRNTPRTLSFPGQHIS
jgi:hypothetical protein